ncbi:SDR family NAD(P)-dependent oxidoreductase [Chitinophaga japonensis]|uniref:NAD(P)-dependent dehydrogenase (Short-subunit alcohol dehydrogenase family) n=1 Tax=Chitinophaga japonensis TaxID=104662 RepID=A0A562T070_CHIJA|nr:glucose 1-dehydrogenase [Chitinophaga japonensis]TWI86698.1 NAD(P)-dependent dehydrogenase (short-subunit alcohol dehydrogenase family) [Chitinophaga japonensis]
METLLKNKVALVTGGTSGIGRSIAIAYAQAGAKVVVNGTNDERGAAVVAEITEAGGEALYVKADVGSARDCEMLVHATLAAFSRLDIACNNAGIFHTPVPVVDFDEQLWQRVINTNLNGTFYCMRYQLPAMLAQGSGVIINMSSVAGQICFPGISAYAATKHGIIGLTKTAALEYADRGIRINAVGPAIIDTPMVENNFTPEQLDLLLTRHPGGRFGRAEEVAELVLWLSSARASFVNGSYYAIDGGYLAQ